MKKIVSIIMLTALLFTSITNGTTSKAISQYKRITSGNYEYAVLDEANKTATVLKIKPTKEVVIPKIIDGYSIVQIGICWNEYDYYFNEENEYHFTDSEYAEFKNSRHVFSTDSKSVEKITIPEGVKKIGEFAFANTPNLKQLNLPKSLKYIYAENFLHAAKLTKIVFKDSICVRNAFANIKNVVLNGNFDSNFWEDCVTPSRDGMHGKINQLEVKGKRNVTISAGSKIQKIIVSKSVKDLYISDSNLVKKLNVKSKKTKVSIDPNLTSIIRTQFDMGTYAKKKSGNYTWSKPYFKLVSNDDGNYKKQISYLVKYKKNGKSKTKTVKKNKIKKLYSSSKIHVYAIVKVKKQRVPYMP